MARLIVGVDVFEAGVVARDTEVYRERRRRKGFGSPLFDKEIGGFDIFVFGEITVHEMHCARETREE